MIWILNLLFSPLPTPALIGLITFGTTLFLWLITKPKPNITTVDFNKQAIRIEGGAKRSALVPDGSLLTHYYEDVKTAYEAFKRGLYISENGPCLGHRRPNQPYQWISYQKVLDRAEWLGSGLLYKGCKSDQFIGILSQNRPECVIAEIACQTYSMIIVPLYETLGPEAFVFVVNQADISTIICDKPEKAQTILENYEQGKIPGLKTIIMMDPFDDRLTEKGAMLGVEIISFLEIEALGKENVSKPIPPKPDDTYVVCFTSGTTSTPKGVVMTHANFIASISGILKYHEVSGGFNTSDVSISYLPLAHGFERIIQTLMFISGGRVGFYQGDIKLLLTDDIKTLKPTLFPAVPRLLHRIHDQIQSDAQSRFKRLLLNFALNRKNAELKQGIIRNTSIWDKLVFNKIQEALGGKVKLIVSGAAPISPSILATLKAALGCYVAEAYGQTECCGACTITFPGDWKGGHVGPPVACNFIKLADVPEMNYFTSNNEGEICIKGPNVFKGYLKDPEKTAEVMDNDGWLHTGDIGTWMPGGVLKITDRKKDIFKLSQGEYIAPAKIENIYIRCASVAQIFVHGDSLQSFLVGIMVPDEEFLSDFAANLGIRESYEELCKNPAVKNAILKDMTKFGKDAGLKSFEQVKDIYIHPEMLSVESGLLTPTMKTKRTEMLKFFRSQIDAMYASNM